MTKTLNALSAAAAVAACALSAPAHASLVLNPNGTITIDKATTGGTATINFDGNVNSNTIAGMHSQLTLTFLSATTTGYYFSYSLLNNSSVGSRTSGFAFDTNPNVSGGTATGLFTNLITFNNPGNQQYPNGVGAVEVCLGGGGNSCEGGGSAGVFNNAAAGTGKFTLLFATPLPTTITLSDFFVRYQDVVGVPGGTSGTGSQIMAVPEPSTWALMLLGFGGIGMAMRRQRRVSAGQVA